MKAFVFFASENRKKVWYIPKLSHCPYIFFHFNTLTIFRTYFVGQLIIYLHMKSHIYLFGSFAVTVKPGGGHIALLHSLNTFP